MSDENLKSGTAIAAVAEHEERLAEGRRLVNALLALDDSTLLAVLGVVNAQRCRYCASSRGNFCNCMRDE